MHKIDFKLGRESRDSKEHEVKWNLCRECRTVQHCVTLRGYPVCRTCSEKIDHYFCKKRADEFFEELDLELEQNNLIQNIDEGPRNPQGKCDVCPEMNSGEDCTIPNCPLESKKETT